MSSLKLKIEGRPGEVSLSAFVGAVSDWMLMLRDIDAALSGVSTGSLDWLVSDLRTGSLVVEAEWSSRLEGRNVGPDVARYAIEGLNLLEREGLTPPFLSETGLGHVKRMVKLIGNRGVTGIIMSNHAGQAQLSARASANVEQLLPARSFSIGSVQGKLEAINLHGRAPKFTVYHHISGKGVACRFPLEKTEEVKDALGRRVVICGTVHYNAKAEPVRIDLEEIKPVPDEAGLPRASALTGSIPSLTGNLSTAEYLEAVRGG